MSMKTYGAWWPRGCCQGCCRSSSTRQRAIQLFCAILLVSTVAMTYLSSRPGLFNKVARNESAFFLVDPHHVVLTSHQVKNTNVNSSSLTTTTSLLTSSDLLSLPTSNTSSLRSASSTAPNSTALTPSSLPLMTTKMLGVDGYVSFPRDTDDGRGLGNLMFNLAAVIYVAELTGRQPGLVVFVPKLILDTVFDLGIKRFVNLCPCLEVFDMIFLGFDHRLEELANGGRYAQDARGKSISLSGYFQSWKYTLNVEHRLRQHFTFLPEIRQCVDKFQVESRPPGWVAGYVRVGVHARRGDVLEVDKMKYGYTTPDERYFAHAMQYFIDRFDRVQFIVASNDIAWCRQNFDDFVMTQRHRVNVTYLQYQSPGADLAILASCEHTIMSTGTFGWWAAWLARGITIYYADWPRNGSDLAEMFIRDDFFPPKWIGMT